MLVRSRILSIYKRLFLSQCIFIGVDYYLENISNSQRKPRKDEEKCFPNGHERGFLLKREMALYVHIGSHAGKKRSGVDLSIDYFRESSKN